MTKYNLGPLPDFKFSDDCRRLARIENELAYMAIEEDDHEGVKHHVDKSRHWTHEAELRRNLDPEAPFDTTKPYGGNGGCPF